MESNPTHPSSADGSGNEYSLADDVARLQSLIFKLPGDLLLERLRSEVVLYMDIGSKVSHQKIDPNDVRELPPETPKLLAGAARRIASLNHLAMLGDSTAILGLKQIAETITQNLVTLMRHSGAIYESTNSSLADVPMPDPAAIAAEAKEVMKRMNRNPIDALASENERLSQKVTGYLVVRSDAVFADPSFSLAPLLSATERARGQKEALPDQRPFQVEQILEQLVNIRLRVESSMIARRTASKSFYWPITADAIEDSRASRTESKVSFLGLGSGLSFRVQPKGGSGGIRDFRVGSKCRFALEILSQLELQRKLAQDRRRSKSNYVLSGLLQKPEPWERLASKLDPFDSTEGNIDAWVDAATAFAEHECGGDWNSHKWPSCVLLRLRKNSVKPRHRTVEEAVKQKLREGMVSLLKTQASTRKKKKRKRAGI